MAAGPHREGTKLGVWVPELPASIFCASQGVQVWFMPYTGMKRLLTAAALDAAVCDLYSCQLELGVSWRFAERGLERAGTIVSQSSLWQIPEESFESGKVTPWL